MDCPGCGEEMEVEAHPDMEFEACPGCGGVFLDPGELNALATGLAGDIEFWSVNAEHPDSHPARECGRCGVPMEKVNVLTLSDLIFDHCPDCGGFYLDRGEVGAMNEGLRELAETPFDRELRERRDGHLVRVDRVSYVTPPADFSPARTLTYLETSVYLEPPLGLGLRVKGETWTTRLVSLVGLAQDVEVGDEAFDDAFRVQAGDPTAARSLLTEEVRRALLGLKNEGPRVLKGTGHGVELYDDRVSYREGPFDPEDEPAGHEVEERLDAVVDRVVAVAAALERAR